MSNADKIPVEDISKTIRFLLELSSSSAVKEVMIDCRKMVEFIEFSIKKIRRFSCKD